MECNYCNQEKLVEEFPRWEKYQWKICRVCLTKKNKEYYQKNRDAIQKRHQGYDRKEYMREYYQRNKKKKQAYGIWYNSTIRGKQARRDYNREYYQDTKEKQRRKAKQWRKENPDKLRLQGQVKRARKVQAESELWTHEEIAAQGVGFCPYCGKKIGLVYDSKIMHIDHKMPLCRGGSNLKENLEATCILCNLSKHTKTKEEFLCELECKVLIPR